MVDDGAGGAVDGFEDLRVGGGGAPRWLGRRGGDENYFVIGLSGEELFSARGSGDRLAFSVDGRDDNPVLVKGQVRGKAIHGRE